MYKYIRSNRKTKKNKDPLINGEGKLTVNDAGKPDGFNTFSMVFPRKVNHLMTKTVNTRNKRRDNQPGIMKEQVRGCLAQLDVFKSVGVDERHPGVLKGLAEVITEPLAITFENTWRLGGVYQARRGQWWHLS